MTIENHHLRETVEDKKKEEVILRALVWHFNKQNVNQNESHSYQQVMTHGKYKIDGWVYNQNAEITHWVECKALSKEGFYGVNFPKYIEGVNLARESGLPFLYAFCVKSQKGNKKIGYFTVHNGIWEDCKQNLNRCGGTPPGRSPNWDDIEPMMMFIDATEINWIWEGS
jgi:hypothetical protein